MTPSAPSPFTISLQHSADLHQIEMWRAAQTVRAHVSAEDGLDAMLDCLGLTDAQQPVRG